MISGFFFHCRPRRHPYIVCTYCTISDVLDIEGIRGIIESVAPNPRAVLVLPTHGRL
jgi:hypothetical protein